MRLRTKDREAVMDTSTIELREVTGTDYRTDAYAGKFVERATLAYEGERYMQLHKLPALAGVDFGRASIVELDGKQYVRISYATCG